MPPKKKELTDDEIVIAANKQAEEEGTQFKGAELAPDNFLQESRDVKLEASMTATYGGVTLTYGAEIIHGYGSEPRLQAAYTELTDMLRKRHEDFVNNILPRYSPLGANPAANPSPQQGNGNSRQGSTGDYIADRIIRVEKGGKDQYRVITHSGRYMKYGCLVFENVLKEFGLLDLMDGIDALPIGDLSVYIEDDKYGGTVKRFFTTPDDVKSKYDSGNRSNQEDIPF